MWLRLAFEQERCIVGFAILCSSALHLDLCLHVYVGTVCSELSVCYCSSNASSLHAVIMDKYQEQPHLIDPFMSESLQVAL